jgi:diguanylate cyclase (GGDEF)-like protein
LQYRTQSGTQVTTSVSCGVAALDDGAQTPAQLLAAADSGLLAAKRAGRNRSVVSD